MDELKDLITEQNDPEQVFQLLDILGQGSYGSVSKALHKQTGVLYAIKILPATSGVQISAIKKQIGILKECNNDHIVRYFGSYYKDDHLWIVMEYCIAGSVMDIMQITKKKFNQNQIASILQSVLKGIDYIHARKKIHRDIKAANILLDQRGNAKLADFGVSASSMNTNARFRTHIGSPYWMSPQILNYHEYNYKTDIWSLGITAIQIAEGQVPNSHIKPFMAVFMIKSNPVQSLKNPQIWSNQFNDFVKKCLQINAVNRPQAKQLLQHQFIKKYSKGQRLLSELVLNSIQQIEQFRMNQSRNSSFVEIIFDQNREQKKTLIENDKKNQSQEQQIVQEQLQSSMVMKNSCEGSVIAYDNSMIEYNQTQNSSKQNDPLTSYIKGLKKQQSIQVQCIELMVSSLNKYDQQLKQKLNKTFNQFKSKALNDINSIKQIKDKNPNIALIAEYTCKLISCQTLKQFIFQSPKNKSLQNKQKQSSVSLLLNSRMKTQNQTTPHSKITQIKYMQSTQNKLTTDVFKKTQETLQFRQQIKSFLIPNNSTNQTQQPYSKKSHGCIFNQPISLLSSIKPTKIEAPPIKIPHNSSRIMIKRSDQNTQATQSQVKQFTNDPQVLEYLLQNKYLKSQTSVVQSRSNLLAVGPSYPQSKINRIVVVQQKSRQKSKQQSKSKNKIGKNIKNKKIKNKLNHWPQC